MINEKRLQNYLRNLKKVFDTYQFKEPFSRFLSRFFKENKQMGSSDRRMTSRFSYHIFRLGGAFGTLDLLERLSIAEFLCSTDSAMVAYYHSEWMKHIQEPLATKIAFIAERYGDFLGEVFPWQSSLSAAVNASEFLSSFFVQPDVFIRIQRDNVALVKDNLQKEGISFYEESARSLRLDSGVKLQDIPRIRGCFEVQDLSSQYVETVLEPTAGEKWWD